MIGAATARTAVAISALLLGTLAAGPVEPMRHLEYRTTMLVDDSFSKPVISPEPRRHIGG
jgi:hypothetical protein